MPSINLTQLNASDPDFNQQLSHLIDWDESDDLTVQQLVLQIIQQVRHRGDDAVIKYTNQFDRTQFNSITECELDTDRLKQSWDQLDSEQANALKIAAERIQRYAENQKQEP